MTVCIAALFHWSYPGEEQGNLANAAIVVTDRMITAGDVQYEPQQTKMAYITPGIVLSIAGDYSLHSQAVKKTVARFRDDHQASPENVASFYGRMIQAIKLKEAEDLFLAPVGLNMDSFLAQQKEMAPNFVSQLTDQMQAYRGEEVEALVVGSSNNTVSIYGIDTKGIISCFDDVGFAATGSGAWHAKSRLMQIGYVNSFGFSPALGSIFAAKKVSETAPGVGHNTDITLVFKHNCVEPLRLDVAQEVNRLFLEYRPKVDALGLEYIERIQKYISKPSSQVVNEDSIGFPGADAQTDARVDQPAAETERKS